MLPTELRGQALRSLPGPTAQEISVFLRALQKTPRPIEGIYGEERESKGVWWGEEKRGMKDRRGKKRDFKALAHITMVVRLNSAGQASELGNQRIDIVAQIQREFGETEFLLCQRSSVICGL